MRHTLTALACVLFLLACTEEAPPARVVGVMVDESIVSLNSLEGIVSDGRVKPNLSQKLAHQHVESCCADLGHCPAEYTPQGPSMNSAVATLTLSQAVRLPVAAMSP